MKKILLLIAIIILGLGGFIAFGSSHQQKQTPTVVQQKVSPSPIQKDVVAYKGKAGEDALTLLKSQTLVEQNEGGLVTTIGGRKADAAKKEYWAFYVNGKMADVGPADYQTKNGDTIVWKIEKY